MSKNDKEYNHNAKTGEISIRELTDDEQTIRNAEIAATKKAEAEAKASAKSALIAKLGLNEDEAKLLLG